MDPTKLNPEMRALWDKRKLNLIVTAEPSDDEVFTVAELLYDATELCRRLNVEAVKIDLGDKTYYVHQDHVVVRTERNDYDVIREPFDGK